MTDLKIYWSNLTPTRNAWVDDIETYLSGLQVLYHCEDFQYQRFENDMEIVVPVPQADLSQQEVGNYVRIYQDNVAWYYFVMSYKWTSKSSLRLSLSIDSVNTFVGTHIHFSPKTVIERQHKDRYIYDPDNDTKILIKQFDVENEEIPVNQERTAHTVVKQNNSNNNWYLIYDSESVIEEDSKPVRCRLIADQPLTVYKSSTVGPTQTWYSDDIAEGQYYYMDGVENDLVQLSMTLPWRISGSDSWVGTPLNLGDEMIVDGPSRTINVHGHNITVYGYWRGIINGFRVSSESGDVVVALSLRDVQFGESNAIRINGLHWPGTYVTAPDWTTGGLNHGFSFIEVQQLKYYRYSTAGNIPIAYSSYIIPDSNRVTVSIGSLITRTTIPFNQLDRTDSRLVKIINLPYAPCEVAYDADTGVYTFPAEWVYEDGFMRLTDTLLYTEFESQLDDVDCDFLLQHLANAPAITQNRLLIDDPKLDTSQFSTYKILYDSFSQDLKLERFTLTDATIEPKLPIKFKPTNTINSKFAFYLDWDHTVWGSDANIKHYTDYDNYLLVNRNNEETIFSSDYLNYLRNGYNYDKKLKSEQSTMSYAMGAVQVVGAAASFIASIWTGGASAAAGIALATGAVTTFTTAAYQEHANDQALAQKLHNLQMQSASVAGSDDVDLLKYYSSNNKLCFVVFKPMRFQAKALNNLFYYCGYKHKAMEVPNTTSRTWFNFIQCKPVFVEEENGEVGAPYNKFWDDIKTRFAAGVTRYHRVNSTYDWAQEKENWEVSLF